MEDVRITCVVAVLTPAHQKASASRKDAEFMLTPVEWARTVRWVDTQMCKTGKGPPVTMDHRIRTIGEIGRVTRAYTSDDGSRAMMDANVDPDAYYAGVLRETDDALDVSLFSYPNTGKVIELSLTLDGARPGTHITHVDGKKRITRAMETTPAEKSTVTDKKPVDTPVDTPAPAASSGSATSTFKGIHDRADPAEKAVLDALLKIAAEKKAAATSATAPAEAPAPQITRQAAIDAALKEQAQKHAAETRVLEEKMAAAAVANRVKLTKQIVRAGSAIRAAHDIKPSEEFTALSKRIIETAGSDPAGSMEQIVEMANGLAVAASLRRGTPLPREAPDIDALISSATEAEMPEESAPAPSAPAQRGKKRERDEGPGVAASRGTTARNMRTRTEGRTTAGDIAAMRMAQEGAVTAADVHEMATTMRMAAEKNM